MAGDAVKICEVGDVLYKVKQTGEIVKITIAEVIDYGTHYIYKDENKGTHLNRTIRKTCFRTMEEAEKEVWRLQDIKEKKALLKEYERELNAKYNLGNHFFVK